MKSGTAAMLSTKSSSVIVATRCGWSCICTRPSTQEPQQTQKKPAELRLYAMIMKIREDLDTERVRNCKHVPDPKNLTDVMTKRGVSKNKKERLRRALTTGRIFELH